MQDTNLRQSVRRAIGQLRGANDEEALEGVDSLGPVLTIVPFTAIAVIGQLVVIFNPEPIDVGYLIASSALLLVALIALLLPAVRTTTLGPLAILVTYVASVSFLQLAEGGTSTGSGVLLLVPLVASALFFQYRDTVGVTVAVMISIVVVSVETSIPFEVTLRKLVLWMAICVLVAVPIHALRLHLRRSVVEARRLLHQSRTLEAAARQLTSMRSEDDIVSAAARLASLVLAVPGEPAPSASYLRVRSNEVVPVASADDGSEPAGAPARVTLAELESSLLPEDGGAGADAHRRAASVALRPEGRLHGYLYVVSRDDLPLCDQLDGLSALGQLVELALSDLFAHRRLEDQAMAEERRRIARELHDGLAHELAFIASRARTSAVRTPDPSAAELARSADRALDEARRAITVLSSREPLKLGESVAQTAEDLGARYGLPIGFEVAEGVDVEPVIGEHLLRIVREAITNAARHASPSRITIRFWEDDQRHLVIEDDGVGFDPDAPRSGFGLTSMQERAEAVGGVLVLRSAPREGTRVEVLVP